MHFGKTTSASEGEFRMVVMVDSTLHLVSVINGDHPSTKPQGNLLALANKSRYLKSSTAKAKNSCRNLKFLRFIDIYNGEQENEFDWYEIYDFDSGSWKTLDVTPNWLSLFGSRGVSFKGNTYWLASERNSEDYDDHIICFDFTREMFGPLLRLPFDAGNRDYVNLSCVREEKLAVSVRHRQTRETDIWITTKIEAEEVLWSKFLTVDTENHLLTSERFFIEEETKLVMGLELNGRRETFKIIGVEAGYFTEFDFGNGVHRDYRAHACSYVPSLMQIKQPPAGRKWKHQSDSEKLRYDQNKSRLVSLEKRAEEEMRNPVDFLSHCLRL
ncbi:unnamed protein product [Microthlaspi erraticum]|uniref:F-box associated beta-propeller type 1 domain-containing protein n=1 Tax=Microthlaspi erraticum TaxID=1685480 RepID=A0A6D2L0T3_9BRAS|nr:unnamed protein product [Microthlaspi erraticum]